MVNDIRDYFPKNATRPYYISGAPECFLNASGNPFMGKSMQEAKYDYLWIQFYNNNCSANSLFENPAENKNGAGYFNLKDWPAYLSDGASKDAKLLVGLPGAPDAAAKFDYVAPENLASLVAQSKNVTNFAGIMVYDAGAVSQGAEEGATNGDNYIQLAKTALNSA
jgi:chitinase